MPRLLVEAGVKGRIPKGRYDLETASVIVCYNYSLAWQDTESDYSGLMRRVWAERILVFDYFSPGPNHCSSSNSAFHPILLFPCLFLLVSSLVLPTSSISFLELRPWALDSGKIWSSGQPWDWRRIEPSTCFISQRPWPLLLQAALSLSVAQFRDSEDIGCHSHPIPLRKAFPFMKSWSFPPRTKFRYHPSP